MESISKLLRTAASQTYGTYWVDLIKKDFGVTVQNKEPGTQVDPQIARQIYGIFKLLPKSVLEACETPMLYLRGDMGPNMRYSPNHGYFVDHSCTLNTDIFYHPDLPEDFMLPNGYFADRPTQTLLHEYGHACDEYKGDLSLQDTWLKLSGWSQTQKPGLKRLFVQAEGEPALVGEWFYDPKAEFTRFYAMRNPWDDWADSFAMRFCLPEKLPAVKKEYFDALFKNIKNS